VNVIREDKLLQSILPLFGIPNEDAALLELSEPGVVVKVDSFEAELHMFPFMDHRHAGIRAVIAPVSDVLVKGAYPKAALISLRVPRDMSEEAVQRLHRGVLEAASRYGLRVLGGDTDVAPGGSLRLDVFVIGTLKGKFLKRGGAKVGDLVAITGRVGLSAVMHAWAFSPQDIECSLRREDVEGFVWGNIPEPGRWLSYTSCVNSAIDNSDGLALSLHYLAEASGVKIVLSNVPLHARLVECFGEEKATTLALYYSGEEYNFIFTVPPECEDIIKTLGATVIGRVEEGRGVALEGGGEVSRFGWVGGVGYAERV